MFLKVRPRNYLIPAKVDRERYRSLQTIYWSSQPGKPVFVADEHDLLRWYFRQDRKEPPLICANEEPKLKEFPATLQMIDWTLGNSLYRLLRYERAVQIDFIAANYADRPSAAKP